MEGFFLLILCLPALSGQSPAETRSQSRAPLKGEACPELRIFFGEPILPDPPLYCSLPVMLDSGEAQRISGFQFTAAHTCPRVFVTDVFEGAALATIGGADFFTVKQIQGGVNVGAVIDLEPSGDPPRFRNLPPCTAGEEIARIVYDCTRQGSDRMTCTVLFDDTVGDPPVPLAVAVGGTSVAPRAGLPVSFTLWCFPEVPFARGDANQDGLLSMSDAVAVARALFGVSEKWSLIRTCQDAADMNDDGSLNAADPVYFLQYLFLDGPEIPPPYSCDFDATPSQLPFCIGFHCAGER